MGFIAIVPPNSAVNAQQLANVSLAQNAVSAAQKNAYYINQTALTVDEKSKLFSLEDGFFGTHEDGQDGGSII